VSSGEQVRFEYRRRSLRSQEGNRRVRNAPAPAHHREPPHALSALLFTQTRFTFKPYPAPEAPFSVRPDLRLTQDPLEQRVVARFQMTVQREQLIPQRLRVDQQTLLAHHATLAVQWQMIQVLVDGDLDGKLHRVAAASSHQVSLGARRRDHRPVALAAVLLPAMHNQLELALDHRDLFGLLGEEPSVNDCFAMIGHDGCKSARACTNIENRYSGFSQEIVIG